MKSILTGGFAFGACLTWMAIAFALNVLVILFLWNGLDLHSVFSLPALSTPQAIGVALLLSLFGV